MNMLQHQSSSSSAPVQFKRSRGVLFNAAWNYAGSATNLLVTFVTTPLYLHRLGLEQFGVLAVVVAVTTPLMALNAGVTQSAVKFVAQYAVANRLREARAAAWASFIVNFIFGGIGAAICIGLSAWLVRSVFKVDSEVAPAAILSLRLAGGLWLASQLAATFRGVLEGLRNQRRVVLCDMSFALATAGACSLSAFIWPRIDIFVGMQLIVAVVWIFVWAGLARKSLGGLGLEGEPLKPHLSEVRAYSNWQMVNSFFGVAAGVADRYLIGGLMSTATLGAYNVALRVQTAARMSYFGLNQALFPAASAAISQTGAAERLTVEYTWRLMTTAAVAVGFAFVVAPSFLVLWVGPEVAKIAGWSLRWLLVAVVLEIPSATCSSYLFARALNRSQALINGLSTVVTLSAMVVFGKLFGLSGVASSGAISLVLTRIPFHIWVHKQHFHGILSRAEFTTVFYGLAGVVLALAVPIGLAFDHVFLLWVNYWGFAIGAAAFGILYAIATYGAFCLWPENRRRFKKIITEFRNRLCDSVILRRTATQNS